MSENATQFRPVKTLPPETARKIAAGEVIDRPAAIVRELLDNAVDSGASSIHVEIDGGGIERIRVADNGCGMTKEDLENCARPHATSKIIHESDLLSLATLGFRGEALASIAAVSRLEITSFRREHAWKLEAALSGNHRLNPAQLARGTIAQSCGLFENFPARRVFLKREASEVQLCKQVFIEKAIPQIDTAFRLSVDGKIKLDLPAAANSAERFVAALELKEPPSLFYEIAGGESGGDFSFTCVLSDTAVYKNDKKSLFVYINGRRIWEYSLVQAIEYGGQGYFPNGTYPIACLFVTINPSLVDFNIHPAKKEARFKDISALHHAVSSSVRNFYKNHSAHRLVQQTSHETYEGASITANARPDYGFADKKTAHFNAQPKRNCAATFRATTEKIQSPYDVNTQHVPTHNSYSILENQDFTYIGSALGVFIIIEKDAVLYLIDQHAAQERVLYDRFMQSVGQKQTLLFPYVIETETEADDAYLETIVSELDKTGFTLHNAGSGRWEASAVPIKWNGTEEDLTRDLLKNRVVPAELCAKLAASYVCRCAVKDGTVLDSATATELASQALSLSDPHCPHGRPIWTTVTKAALFKLVRRTE